ncbi:pentapeptide repeat-containing protein [Mucilaginibacter terrenus]|uniref:Pentapeptide repeat-containing protein n=1 Tax=Mucilaginibacter terrenus TaxID=2482727 RepID=A0A3E2NL36_9SPHI|nr:pentapeptide repeat-containing protein [Mucilaginibacter terrenus]RFZ81705.1 pentapeptide repeat-containing protein [Mucilaginibacter terrenus]
MANTIEDKTFTSLAVADLKAAGTYENCTFKACLWPKAYLNGFIFIDCVFEECDLTQADIGNSGLQNAVFKNCRLNEVNFSKGLDFLFAVNFEGCVLDHAVFHRKKNKKANFTDCSLREADFSDTDLTDAKFVNCDLHRAAFSQTILRNADLRTSYNFTIDPDDNVVKNARFSVHGLPGLLEKYSLRITG